MSKPSSFPHHELARRTEGRVQRMRILDAPEWLIRAEEDANRDGYTMRRIPGCGPTYYRVPLATPEEELKEALQRQSRRLEREGNHERMPPSSAYGKALSRRHKWGPDEWAGDFEDR